VVSLRLVPLEPTPRLYTVVERVPLRTAVKRQSLQRPSWSSRKGVRVLDGAQKDGRSTDAPAIFVVRVYVCTCVRVHRRFATHQCSVEDLVLLIDVKVGKQSVSLSLKRADLLPLLNESITTIPLDEPLILGDTRYVDNLAGIR
jgi:hypothetical protein